MKDPLHRFLDVVRDNPDGIAIHTERASWTYAELHQHVQTFASVFARKEAPRIAIILPQCNEVYAAFLGAGFAGGYYAPLNIQSPLDKLQRIIDRLRPDFILAEARMVDDLARIAPYAEVMTPDVIETPQPFDRDIAFHEYSHIIFTSGSTGIPKGVIIPREAMVNFVDWLDVFDLTPEDRVSQQPNIAFDMSQTDIYAAFCFGATLYPLAELGDKTMPGRFVKKHGITFWNSTPSVISQMRRGGQLSPETFSTVRYTVFAGEPLFVEQVEALFEANPDLVICNSYGPTETTITMTYVFLTKDNYKNYVGTSMALGDLYKNMELELVDGPHEDEGEALIYGPQVASGYWGDPEKTAAVFFQRDGVRGYRSGDWLVRAEDGRLFFKERVDFQVKIRGFRVELDEVAAAIRRTGWAVVVAFKHDDMLAAVVEQERDKTFNERKLKKELEAYIEKHAIPDRIIVVDAIPRNTNEKLDRKATAALFAEQMAGKADA